jgi:hypothetical protein
VLFQNHEEQMQVPFGSAQGRLSTALRMTGKSKCKINRRSFDCAQDDRQYLMQEQIQEQPQVLRLPFPFDKLRVVSLRMTSYFYCSG